MGVTHPHRPLPVDLDDYGISMMSSKTALSPVARKQRWKLLEQRMSGVAELLEHQGTITSRMARGRRVWSVRFHAPDSDGRSVHRAIYVGDDSVLLKRSRRLLASFRSRQRWPAEAKRIVHFTETLVSAMRQCMTKRSR